MNEINYKVSFIDGCIGKIKTYLSNQEISRSLDSSKHLKGKHDHNKFDVEIECDSHGHLEVDKQHHSSLYDCQEEVNNLLFDLKCNHKDHEFYKFPVFMNSDEENGTLTGTNTMIVGNINNFIDYYGQQ